MRMALLVSRLTDERGALKRDQNEAKKI